MLRFAIEQVNPRNFDDVWPLVADCLAFYGLDSKEFFERKVFFQKISEYTPNGVQHLCRMKSQTIGFSTVYFSFSSFYGGPVAFLNDLYVSENCRGLGAGSALLQNVRDVANSRGIKYVQWLSSPNNTTAHSFFERLECKKTEWFRYTWEI